MTAGIYQIKNIRNTGLYVGSSIDIDKRLKEHKDRLKKGKHPNKKLQDDWNKYGEEYFDFYMCEYVSASVCLLAREQYYINTEEPEYNISKIANGRLKLEKAQERERKRTEWRKGITVEEDSALITKR